jgi:hypothetical protein
MAMRLSLDLYAHSSYSSCEAEALGEVTRVVMEVASESGSCGGLEKTFAHEYLRESGARVGCGGEQPPPPPPPPPHPFLFLHLHAPMPLMILPTEVENCSQWIPARRFYSVERSSDYAAAACSKKCLTIIQQRPQPGPR